MIWSQGTNTRHSLVNTLNTLISLVRDMFTNMKNGEVEVADGVGDLGAGIGEPFEMFEKEDMSDMFKRAMLEKMQLTGEKINPNKKSNYKQIVQRSRGRCTPAWCAPPPSTGGSSPPWATSSTPSASSAPTAGR